MRKNPRLLVLLSTVLLIVALGTGIWSLLAEPNAQRQQLPDGAVLRLVGVTYGTQHTLVLGAPWQKLFAPVLPARFKPRLVSGRTFPENRLVCWFSGSLPVNQGPQGQSYALLGSGSVPTVVIARGDGRAR